MKAILLEILIVLLLMIANGIFSMSEMAIVSARRARLQQAARRGDRRAELALALSESPDRLLSTVQIGITLIGILAGAVGGATIAEQLGAFFSQFPPLAESAEMIGVVIVVLGITFLSLIIGELVPKRMALSAPEKIARAVAGPMNRLAIIASPLVRILEISTRLVFSLLRLKTDATPSITEEEIRILIEEGARTGVFNPAEELLVRNVFRLADQRISTLMTPRLEMVWLDASAPVDAVRQRALESQHTCFPVGRGATDEIIGVVRAKDLLAPGAVQGANIDWKSILIAPPRLVETLSALDALEHFKSSPIPMAIVIDQHGGVEGLITTQDILSGIVGDGILRRAPGDGEAVEHEDGSWTISGTLSLHRLRDLIPLGTIPGEERGHFSTLSGLLMNELGRIPVAGDLVEWKNFNFQVMRMEGRRVGRVRLTITAAAEE